MACSPAELKMLGGQRRFPRLCPARGVTRRGKDTGFRQFRSKLQTKQVIVLKLFRVALGLHREVGRCEKVYVLGAEKVTNLIGLLSVETGLLWQSLAVGPVLPL